MSFNIPVAVLFNPPGTLHGDITGQRNRVTQQTCMHHTHMYTALTAVSSLHAHVQA